jgi:predicted nucleotidyltransferase
MRLTADQSRDIVRAIRDLAGNDDASARLFGSRTRDDLRGGDTDLVVEGARPVAQPVWLAARITARLQRALGERKIDVLVVDPDTEIGPVHAAARVEAALLGA